MDKTKIVRVCKCTNNGCIFHLQDDKCCTSPEMDTETNECLSNTDDWTYLILNDRIITEDIEDYLKGGDVN